MIFRAQSKDATKQSQSMIEIAFRYAKNTRNDGVVE